MQKYLIAWALVKTKQLKFPWYVIEFRTYALILWLSLQWEKLAKFNF